MFKVNLRADMDTTEDPAEIIERLGGPTRTAKLCRISAQAVVQWKINGIPDARRQYLELIRPDAFGKPKRSKSAPAAT